MKKKLSAILFSSLVGLTFSSMAAANVKFSDSTFNLADYSISKYQEGEATPKVTVSQILTGGNPGSALEIDTNVQAGHGLGFASVEYLINTTFRYDPSTQGAVVSIDAAIDASHRITENGTLAPYHPFGGSGGALVLLRQAGSIYTNLLDVTGPPVIGTGDYSMGHAMGLKSTDFGLVTDLTALTIDKTQNPSFSNGIIELGIPAFNRYRSAFGIIPEVNAVSKYDNLNFTVNTIPEPETYAMLLAGLGLIGSMARRKIKSMVLQS